MLAIAGGKGGCGKTTTTLGLAAALGRQRTSVLAVDADRDMPNLHRLANVPRSPGLADLGEEPIVSFARESATLSGVSVLPSSAGTSTADLETALARLGDRAGPVLVDCPAGAGRTAVAPLRAADRTLLVTTLHPRCLRDTLKTSTMARELGTGVAGVVVTKVAAGTPVRPVEQVGAVLDCPVLARVPSAPADNGTAVLGDPSVGTSYGRLACALRGGNS